MASGLRQGSTGEAEALAQAGEELQGALVVVKGWTWQFGGKRYTLLVSS